MVESTTVHVVVLDHLNPAEDYDYYIVATTVVDGQTYTASYGSKEQPHSFTTETAITVLQVEDYYEPARDENGVRVYWESADETERGYLIEIFDKETQFLVYSTKIEESGRLHEYEIPTGIYLPENVSYEFKVNMIISGGKGGEETRSDNSIHMASSDMDGDGLTDAEEIRGWEVFSFQRLGDWDSTSDYSLLRCWVRSDPCVGGCDDDNDGWNDFEEKKHRCAPSPRATGGGGGGGHPPLICSIIELPSTSVDGYDTDGDGIRDSIDPLPNQPKTAVELVVKDWKIYTAGMIDEVKFEFSVREEGITQEWVGGEGKWKIRFSNIPPMLSEITLENIKLKKRTGDVWTTIDINPEGGQDTLTLAYDIVRGTWEGDDTLFDKDGYGHAKGDATANCGEIWFEIRQSDIDIDASGLCTGDAGKKWSGWNLTVARELEIGTDPLSADTDRDGLPDGWEYKYGLNPCCAVGIDGTYGNPDGDALSNIQEYTLGTNPVEYTSVGEASFRMVNVYSERFETCIVTSTSTTYLNFMTEVAEGELASANDPIYGHGYLPGWMYWPEPTTDTLKYPTLGVPEIVVRGDSGSVTVYIEIGKKVSGNVVVTAYPLSSGQRYGNGYTASSVSSISPTKYLTKIWAVFSEIPIGYMYDLEVVGQEGRFKSAHSLYVASSTEFYSEIFTFVQLTDTHAGRRWWGYDVPGGGGGRTTDYHMARLYAIIQYLNNPRGEINKPKFALFTGDLIDDPWDTYGMKTVRSIIKVANFPVFCTPGNHDGSIISPYDAYISQIKDYYFRWGNYEFISYDSGCIDDFSTRLTGLESWQLWWLEGEIKEAHNSGKRVFVFSHGPNVGNPEFRHFQTMPMFGTNDNDMPFVKFLAENPDYVEAVFCGHTHEKHEYGNAITPISPTNINTPPRFSESTIPLGWPTVYIITSSSTER
ncbi:MAG: metallophosphoesterase [Thermoplasmata archaeon]